MLPKRAVALSFAVLVNQSCGGVQSSLDPHGPAARGIANLWWYMLGTLGAGYLVTALLVALAISVSRRSSETLDDRGSKRLVLTWGLIIPGIVFMSILGYSVAVGGTLASPREERGLSITVTGRQYWWQLQYARDGNAVAESANEIHIPAGMPVRLALVSADVIHSFWVPSLTGKMDLIPGRSNELWLRTDGPGRWRGQCAEFCGAQHAHMGLDVIAEPAAEFEQWLNAQQQDAGGVLNPTEQQGQQVFFQHCGLCHAVRGTPAHGSFGPDLTHIASRSRIAASTLSNTPSHLAEWITNAQGIKPGSKMPQIALGSEQLSPLVSYLEKLR
jgi:cytochrome c oxidase subunit II